MELPSEPVDTVEIGARSSGVRVMAGIGLALMGATLLTGCGGPQPPPPKTDTATTLQEKVQQLIQAGRHQEAARVMESGYYQRVLTQVAQVPDPALQELARQGLSVYQLNGDTQEMNSQMRTALTAIAEKEGTAPTVARYQEVARMALDIGNAIGQSNPANQGLFGEIRAEALKKGLEEVLKLPQRVDENASGVPSDLVKAYIASLTDTAQLALDAGKDYQDPGVRSVVYQNTLAEIGEKVRQDGDVLGTEVQKILEIIETITRQ